MFRALIPFAILLLVLSGFVSPSPVLAQTRIQGKEIPKDQEQQIQSNVGTLLDQRELMRTFIQNISSYAHMKKRSFIVLVKGNLELLEKIGATEESKGAPARAYMRSINGVIDEGLFFGEKIIGEATPKDRLEKRLEMTELAKKGRLKVLVMDYVKDAKQASQAYRLNIQKGYIPYAANAYGEELNNIPPFSKTPIGENPKSILSLREMKNFIYLGETSGFGRQDEFAFKMHDNNFDMLVVDVFHGDSPLSRQAIETMKYKKIGAKRLVLAHMDIGSAAAYNYFWESGWREGSPPWIASPHKDNPDKYFVQYWHPGWQSIIFGDTNSYVYGLIAQGFDGVVIDGLEAYKFFIGGDDEEENQ